MSHLFPVDKRNEILKDEGVDIDKLNNLRIVHQEGNTSHRRRAAVLPLNSYTSTMLVADQAFEMETMRSDSHSIATLLLLRNLHDEQNPRGYSDTPIA